MPPSKSVKIDPEFVKKVSAAAPLIECYNYANNLLLEHLLTGSPIASKQSAGLYDFLYNEQETKITDL